MKILAFGHIPTWAGGLQTQGAANVIYNLALNMSKIPNCDVYLAVSDVFVPRIIREDLTILGWTKWGLLFFAITHPFLSVSYFFTVLKLKKKYPHAFEMFGSFFKGLHLRKSIEKVKPDFLHLHGTDAAIYEKIVPKDVGIIVTFHGMAGNDEMIEHTNSYAQMEKDICHSNRYLKYYFISKQVKADFDKYYDIDSSSVEIILNAFNSDFFHYIEHQSKDFLTVCTIASMCERKGQERVLKGLIKSGVKCDYICIGSVDPILAERMNCLAKGTSVDLIILGPKEPAEIRNVLASVDYMILPSSSEGFGLVYLESIACGVPVVLPKQLPIVQEKGIIRPGVNALLLDDYSSDAIANKVCEMKGELFEHKKVSQSIIDCSWSNIAKQYYDSILSIMHSSKI